MTACYCDDPTCMSDCADEYRSDDVLGQGYCPRCHRTITIDTALYGHCTEHGKVPADFTRPAGWTDPDEAHHD